MASASLMDGDDVTSPSVVTGNSNKNNNNVEKQTDTIQISTKRTDATTSSSTTMKLKNPLQNSLTLIFLDGYYITLCQNDIISLLSKNHQAAPSEYQVLCALQSKIQQEVRPTLHHHHKNRNCCWDDNLFAKEILQNLINDDEHRQTRERFRYVLSIKEDAPNTIINRFYNTNRNHSKEKDDSDSGDALTTTKPSSSAYYDESLFVLLPIRVEKEQYNDSIADEELHHKNSLSFSSQKSTGKSRKPTKDKKNDILTVHNIQTTLEKACDSLQLPIVHQAIIPLYTPSVSRCDGDTSTSVGNKSDKSYMDYKSSLLNEDFEACTITVIQHLIYQNRLFDIVRDISKDCHDANGTSVHTNATCTPFKACVDTDSPNEKATPTFGKASNREKKKEKKKKHKKKKRKEDEEHEKTKQSS